MRVYKFLSAPLALDDLDKQRVKISTIDELNDPPDENGFRWFNFGNQLDLREVIVGALCSGKDNAKVMSTRRRYPDTVEFFWAGLKKDAFSLARAPQPPSWLTRKG